MMLYFFAGFFLAVVFYALYVGFKYTRMISNIFLSLVYNPSPESLSPTRGEKITILDSSDHELEALLVTTKSASKLIIFCHESGATKESWEKYAYFLPAKGFHILSVDLVPKTTDDGPNMLSQWPTEQDVERLLTVIRWAKKEFPGNTVTLFGVSHGADVAFATSFKDPSIKAVIADGLFSMKEVFRGYIRKWAPVLVRTNLFGEKYPNWVVNIFTNLGVWHSQKSSKKIFLDIEKLLKKKHVPLFMIHGEKDDYIPPPHQKLLEKLNQRGVDKHLVVPRAGHNEAILLGREAYEEKISQFLEQHA